MATVCKQCRRPKGHGHKMDCGSSYSRRNEVWVDNVTNSIVTDTSSWSSSDSSCYSSSSDSGSSSSCDSGSF